MSNIEPREEPWRLQTFKVQQEVNEFVEETEEIEGDGKNPEVSSSRISRTEKGTCEMQQ